MFNHILKHFRTDENFEVKISTPGGSLGSLPEGLWGLSHYNLFKLICFSLYIIISNTGL